ncbi:GH92 family glycosyl hydrolase [Flagellimonas pacifica]|uniref:Alpha-1,2-mannosidase, putative n=1 Tax=Flagellimonas pacifica TaxID=1247520 RepID=A0A285MSJ0_9FLAO|nr:GH92 family glycosyl hydrolase [Allomuricauda parva]SNZ00088.1 alpha-1,2-mannosidase, putative [Allomuricauda parva]
MASLFKKSLFTGTIIICALSCSQEQKSPKQQIDPLNYVDPFIGTGFHGHTFPGPVLPHGMVQLGPDTRLNGWDASSGYHYSDSTIYGFSHTHLSGTGIGDMGDILVLPFTEEKENKPIATFKKSNEHAEVGLYTVKFDNYQVEAKLTATKRAGMHQYSYDPSTKKKLLLDLGHILQQTWGHSNTLNQLEIVNDSTIRGLKQSQGWAYDHKVYFYAKFSSSFAVEEIVVDSIMVNTELTEHEGRNIHTVLNFPSLKNDQSLMLKVGISAVDLMGAENNLKTEISHWNFDKVVSDAKEKWKNELGRIKVVTSNEKVLTTFYTSLYHSMIAPMLYQDVDGRYRGIDKKIHKTKEGEVNYTVYSLWDTFRALHPLMTIIDEPKSIEYVNNLLSKYEQGGLLPKWPLASNYTGTMVGYPAVANIADALSKKLPGIDSQLALKASITSSSYLPELIADEAEPRKKRVMSEHNKYINEGAHIPSDKITGSISYGLENAYYDWCISQIASFANNDSISKEFQQRALAYRQYFDSETGFMRGRNADGSWREPFNPKHSDHEHSDYIEGNAWQWNWFVPHDIEGFAQLYGGYDSFTMKMDSLFSTSSEIEGDNASGDITGLIGQYAHGNEPSHHISHMYTYAGQAWKTQKLVDQILKEFYTTEPDGIIGNEDCGQMSAWYILNAMGFYQVTPGKPEYVIGRPLFDKVEIPLGSGKTFSIITYNNSSENKYVQSAQLNGKELDELFFTHDDIKKGSTLEITMGNRPKKQ